MNGYRVYMMHTPSESPELPGHFPPKVTMLIEGNGISLENSASESQTNHRSASAVTQRRPVLGSRRSDKHQDDGDNRSEDSDAKRITKKSTI
jgi:hypothetical protein